MHGSRVSIYFPTVGTTIPERCGEIEANTGYSLYYAESMKESPDKPLGLPGLFVRTIISGF
jgi:hypothetical protein